MAGSCRRLLCLAGTVGIAATGACGSRTSLDEDWATDLSRSDEDGGIALDAEAGVPELDAGRDAGSDMEMEVDAGRDQDASRAPIDGGRDADDAGFDAPSDASFDSGGDAALLAAPRATAPLSTSRVTSRTPTLRWILPSGVTDVTLDLCLDRACTTSIGAPVHVTGASYAPTSDLPSGVVFWRLHPGAVTAITSPTWQFTVGTRSATIDTSWGTTLDANGDGYADVVVGAWGQAKNTGSAYVYLGSASGLATTPAITLAPLAGSNGYFGWSVASAGDVDGDGYADVIVGAGGQAFGPGTATLYFGGPSGITTARAITLTDPSTSVGGHYFGYSVASAGDVNGDGYADVVVGAYGTTAETGVVYVYFGSAVGPATAPSVTLVGPSGAGGVFGSTVASAGDMNGDGYADLVVGSPGAANNLGSAYVYFGSAAGVAPSPTATIAAPPSASGFADSVASAGDVNGDGLADLILGDVYAANNLGSAYIYFGSATSLPATPVVTLTGIAPLGYFGGSVTSAGDIDGDGYSDVAAGAFGVANSAGGVYVYLGAAAGLAITPATTLSGTGSAGEGFGVSVAGAGDLNGDGYEDLLVGAEGEASGGAAYVYLGSANGLATIPATKLTNPGNAGAHFGWSVFGANN